jgi:hypothetical protein
MSHNKEARKLWQTQTNNKSPDRLCTYPLGSMFSARVGVSDSGNEANLIQKPPLSFFLFSFFLPPTHPPTSFINICEKDCLVGSIMMMEGLAYLVEVGWFFFFFGGHNFNTMWECVWKKKEKRKKKKQEQTTLKMQETGSRKTIFNRDLIGKV